MTRFDRRALFASGAAAALLAATGVSAAPKRGGRLRAALSEALFDRAVASTVYENLTQIGADGTLRGELATEWISDISAREWRFLLRKGVAFHDGTVLTADHVAAVLPFEASAIDAQTVIIRTSVPDTNLPYHLAHPGFEIRSPEGEGTGLYQVQKLDQGRHFIGTRVENHWKDDVAGWFDSVEFAQFNSASVRAEALRADMVDVADITALDEFSDARAFHVLPDGQSPTHITSRKVAVPQTVGQLWPLDNLRMAERWWIT